MDKQVTKRKKDGSIELFIQPSPLSRRNPWRITFEEPVFDYLKARFGNVHQWADQLRDEIEAGRYERELKLLKRFVPDRKPTARAINDLIRALAIKLWVEDCDDF